MERNTIKREYKAHLTRVLQTANGKTITGKYSRIDSSDETKKVKAQRQLPQQRAKVSRDGRPGRAWSLELWDFRIKEYKERWNKHRAYPQAKLISWSLPRVRISAARLERNARLWIEKVEDRIYRYAFTFYIPRLQRCQIFELFYITLGGRCFLSLWERQRLSSLPPRGSLLATSACFSFLSFTRPEDQGQVLRMSRWNIGIRRFADFLTVSNARWNERKWI